MFKIKPKHLSLMRSKNNSLFVVSSTEQDTQHHANICCICIQVQKSMSGASLPEFARQLELYEGPANSKLSSTTVDGEEEEEEEAAAIDKKRKDKKDEGVFISIHVSIDDLG